MEQILKKLLKLSEKAYKKNEIPIACIITNQNNKIIAKAVNNRQKKHNILGHAEIRAVLKAEKKIKDWRLDQCRLYTNLKPCLMCQNIIQEARINNVYYILENEKVENIIKNMNKIDNKYYYEKNLEILQKFFKNKR